MEDGGEEVEFCEQIFKDFCKQTGETAKVTLFSPEKYI